MEKNKKLIAMILALVLISGLAFWGGTLYGKSKSQFNRGNEQFKNQLSQRGQMGNGEGNLKQNSGGFIDGEILSQDDKSLTIKLQDGGSKIIFLSASTTVSKMAEGSLQDLTTGLNIMASGTTNSDGSLTAKTIQIRPQTPPKP
ncbi:MAG: hypothetical protein WCX71_03440 [Candidatus Buchananbacteria bacterium]